VHLRHPGGHLHRGGHQLAGHRPHRHHQRPGQPAGRAARPVRAVHRHVAALLDVAHRHTASSSAVSKLKLQPMRKATRSSRHRSVDVGRLVDQLAVPPHPVARQVGAQVGAGRERRAVRTGVGHVEQRHRLRVALGEQQHVVCPVLGQDDEVGLGVAGAQPDDGTARPAR
jgi:hypothetical protein